MTGELFGTRYHEIASKMVDTMAQEDIVERIQFLVKCKEAYFLVQGFLNDSLPWGHVSERRKGYTYDSSKRQEVKNKVLKSIEVLESAIDNHGLEEIAISYNGGKDCLVMLILLLATIHMKFTIKNEGESGASNIPSDYKLDSIYINTELPFPELSDFIKKTTAYYHLNSIIIKSSLREGFEYYLHHHNSKVKSIVVGIRHSDPYGSELKYEQVTDHSWPKFMRIHPILHWNYVDVWDFLLGCDLDYCSIYDLGYTSLGGVNTTSRNPCLLDKDNKTYYPAYMLLDDADERERLGRNVQHKN